MAADLSQDSVLRFLRSRGGSVRNADLLAHFSRFLREADEAQRARNRELFKRCVNGVATVQRREDGLSYVSLKKKLRPRLEGERPGRDRREVPTQRTAGKTANPGPVRPVPADVLPAAGILNDNNNDVEAEDLEQRVRTPSGQVWEPSRERSRDGSRERSRDGSREGTWNGSREGSRDGSREGTWDGSREGTWDGSREGSRDGSREGTWDGSRERSRDWSREGSRDGSREGTWNGSREGSRDGSREGSRDGSRERSRDGSESQQASSDHQWEASGPVGAVGSGRLREVDGRRQPTPSPEEASVDSLLSAWPFPISHGPAPAQISTSTPCLSDSPGVAPSPQVPYLQGALTQSNDSFLTSTRGGSISSLYIEDSSDYRATAAATPGSSAHGRRSLPPQTLHLPSSTHPDWHRGDGWSSDDGLNYGDRDAVRRSHDAELLSYLHRPERKVAPWHHSTGHLVDEEPPASLPYSGPEDDVRQGPVARRLSQRLRSRMSRSLGSDLDQTFREDSSTARLKRLHRISSFLNVYPTSTTSSQTHSSLDGLSSAGSTHSLAQDAVSCGPRHTQVPLESREHEWFVKAASGSWDHIYALIREDSSLLNKHDFLSGYTVLHWIAKHGDHRVLNTLSYGVSKLGMALDVDARSSCGYTALHLAAIHSHKNLLRLLVHKFKANVALRDNSGKKAWQYLGKSTDSDLLVLLGAPRGTLVGGAGGQWSVEKPPVAPIGHSAATVKRHSSLAALFKHKSHLRLSATAETFL